MNPFDSRRSPFSLREKVRMRGCIEMEDNVGEVIL